MPRTFPRKYERMRRYLSFFAVAIVLLSLMAIADYGISALKHVYIVRVLPPFPTAMDPNFMTQVNDCFLPVAALYGYDLRITAALRTAQEQDALYDEGRTVDGHIVTEAPAGKSIHNYGLAVDVADIYRGYDIDWTKLVAIGAYCGLQSGGTGDLPHFENRGGLTTGDLAEGLRPAPLVLPCAVMSERSSSTDPLTLQDLQSCGAPTF